MTRCWLGHGRDRRPPLAMQKQALEKACAPHFIPRRWHREGGEEWASREDLEICLSVCVQALCGLGGGVLSASLD